MSTVALGTIDPAAMAGIALLALVAGLIKGITGFAFPMIMFSGMSLFFDPADAVACMVLPLLAVNLIQSLQFGYRAAVREARASFLLAAALCICIAVAAPLVTVLSPSALFAVLGPTIILVALIQLAGWRFTLPPRHHKAGAVVTGLAAGICGGFAGVWAPLIVLYLLALNIGKQRHILIQGVIYTAGSLVLIAAHFRTGVVNAESLGLSGALIIPSLLGLGAGAWLLGRIDRQRFVTVTLFVLVAAGLNLVWRACSA